MKKVNKMINNCDNAVSLSYLDGKRVDKMFSKIADWMLIRIERLAKKIANQYYR